jgi:membrane-associated phospholipid phosphatase
MNRRALTLELLAALVVALLLVATVFAVLPLDRVLAADMQHLTNPVLATLLRDASVFGDMVVEAILIGLAATILAWRRRWLEARFVVASSIAAGVLGTVIKMLVGRPRPILELSSGLLWPLFDRYSFPSGHTVFYTAFFGAIAFLLWKRFTGRARWTGIVICLSLIALVGPSRVFLGVHWPSDVLAGYLVGGLCLFAVILSYQWRYRW